jgi:hypothetical protein
MNHPTAAIFNIDAEVDRRRDMWLNKARAVCLAHKESRDS